MVEKTFTFANECTMNIAGAPCGILSLVLQLKGSDLLGIGSSYGIACLSIKNGTMYYSSKDDFVPEGEEDTGALFKVIIYNDPATLRNLRIDFHRLKSDAKDNNEKWKNMIDLGALANPNSDLGELTADYLHGLQISSNIPNLVYIGEIPEGYPEDFETCVGVMLFKEVPGTGSDK